MRLCSVLAQHGTWGCGLGPSPRYLRPFPPITTSHCSYTHPRHWLHQCPGLAIIEFGATDTKNITKWTFSSMNRPEQGWYAYWAAKPLRKWGETRKANLKGASSHPLSDLWGPHLAIWDPVLQKIWTQIKGFVSLGWKTFHHFFLLAWKYNTNYFTRRSESVWKIISPPASVCYSDQCRF